MKVLVSGSTGLVGSAVVNALKSRGDEIVRLVRPDGDMVSAGVQWDPSLGNIDRARLEGFDAVVHLAGENIASRWTKKQKKKIRDSRVEGTKLLCGALAKTQKPPRVIVCASAIGYYGDRGSELLDESSPPGSGFLVDVCRDWEAACQEARDKGIRVVNLRFGVILSHAGGALAKMLLPFKMGLGGVVGSGDQYWSWIALDDVAGAILHSLSTDALSGPVNCVAPQPVTNREFTKALGKVLSRPTVFPMPAIAARLVLGEMANELLLASARVKPKRLEETGFRFSQPFLEPALRQALGK